MPISACLYSKKFHFQNLKVCQLCLQLYIIKGKCENKKKILLGIYLGFDGTNAQKEILQQEIGVSQAGE